MRTVSKKEFDERDLDFENIIPFERKYLKYTSIKGFKPERIIEESGLVVRIDLKQNQEPEKIIDEMKKHLDYSLKKNELKSLKQYMTLRIDHHSIILRNTPKKKPSPLEEAYISKFILGYCRGLTK